MNLDKLFWSNAKVDILKYLIFRRQWISMRALESDLERTYPAIKKQVDTLFEAWLFDINKENTKWSIKLDKELQPFLKDIFLFSFKKHIISIFEQYSWKIKKYYFGKMFWVNLNMDLVIIYENLSKEEINELKKEIWEISQTFFISQVSITCMSQKEREQRYRLADKFVLDIMRIVKE